MTKCVTSCAGLLMCMTSGARRSPTLRHQRRCAPSPAARRRMRHAPRRSKIFETSPTRWRMDRSTWPSPCCLSKMHETKTNCSPSKSAAARAKVRVFMFSPLRNRRNDSSHYAKAPPPRGQVKVLGPLDIRCRSLGAENHFMSAMPRKRRCAVRASPVAMGQQETSCRQHNRPHFYRLYLTTAVLLHGLAENRLRRRPKRAAAICGHSPAAD